MNLLHVLEAVYGMGACCWFIAAAYTLRSRRKFDKATEILEKVILDIALSREQSLRGLRDEDTKTM